jgi:hypothetical protein
MENKHMTRLGDTMKSPHAVASNLCTEVVRGEQVPVYSAKPGSIYKTDPAQLTHFADDPHVNQVMNDLPVVRVTRDAHGNRKGVR